MEEAEVNELEPRVIKQRKLSDSINEGRIELPEYISEHITYILGELEKKKSEGPLVIVSSGMPLKDKQSLSISESPELSEPIFIASTDIKNNQFNLMVMQTEPIKDT